MTVATLGLLLGTATSYDGPDPTGASSDMAEIRDPAVQSQLFDKCVSSANDDGVVSEREYFACAYGVYD